MFYGILIFIHIIVCFVLIIIVLLQSGRGGGLAESFSSAESIFGTKTNTFLTRTTMIFAIVFLITCLTLAFLSKQASKSIMANQKLILKTKKDKNVKDSKETPKAKQGRETDTKIPSNTTEKNTQDKPPVSRPEQKQDTAIPATQESPSAK